MRTISRHTSVRLWTAALLGVVLAGTLGLWSAPDSGHVGGPGHVRGQHVFVAAATPADRSTPEGLPVAGEATDPVIEFRFSENPAGKGAGPWKDGCFRNLGSIDADACIDSDGKGALADGDDAVTFPGNGEGKAVVRLNHDSAFNPGDRDFTVAATVAVTGGQVTANSNVIQKGYFTSNGGQWKLQVDHGKPSCRIAGERDGSRVAAVVEADSSIADSGFVALECRRTGADLTLVVDGEEFTTAQDATMHIKNTRPVTLGGKGSGNQNDQLHGKLKQVLLTIY